MPFYEYQCSACAHRLEALQKISDDPLLYCPECGEASLKKQISKAAFRLKGTGWYETDFKDSGKKESGDQQKSQTNGHKDDHKGAGAKDVKGESSSKSTDSAGKKDDKPKKSSASTEPVKKSA